MKRVTTVTLVWLGCWVAAFLLMAVHFAHYYPAKPVNGGTIYYSLAILVAAPAVLGTPVVGILWVIRFFAWALRRTDATPHGVGFIPPPPRAEPPAQYTITGKRIR